MKLSKWLKPMDTSGLHCNIYITYKKPDGTIDSDMIYAGSMYEIPYWLVDYNITPNDENGESIYWAHGLKKNIDDEEGTFDKVGFVISVYEEKNK